MGCHMKFEISEWDRSTKTVTIITGFIFLISLMFNLFMDINIPVVSPITLGIFSFGLGLGELNLFKENDEKKISLIAGTVLIVMFSICLYIGIMQIEDYTQLLL